MKITITYLEMFASPHRAIAPPRAGLAVVHAKKPSVAYYRYLYDAVGRDYDWTSRKKLSDTDLASLLNDPRMEVHVLMADGVPAGFAELDRRIEGEIELVQFGLTREFIGQGLGRYFLQWTIDKAWSYQPRRFWLHTCTKDHKAALPNYLKAGFSVYKEVTKEESKPPTLIAQPTRIEAAGNKPKLIDEYIGRVNSGHGHLSVAHMRSPGGWIEPGQTPEFEEFTIVLKGMIRVAHRGGVLDVRAGQAVVAHAGEWVQYGTPEPDGAEYIAVCVPAFSPDTVHRDA